MSVQTRNQVPAAHCWDLSALYENIEQWRSDFNELQTKVQEMPKFQGTLAQSAEHIRDAFQFFLELRRLLEKVYVFAHLSSDEDTTNTQSLGMLQEVEQLYAQMGALASYLTPELLEIEQDTLKEYLEDSKLSQLRRLLEEIVRYKAHTLSKEEENILALGSEVFGTSRKVFSQLNNADMCFGELEVEGKKEALTHGNYVLFLKNKNRDLRKRAYSQYYSVFDQHKHTIASTLTGSIKKDLYFSQVRKHNSCLEQALFADSVQASVYENLVSTVSSKLETLHQYYAFRKQCLGIESLKMFDTYVPLVQTVKSEHSFEESVDIVLEALAPLGDEYVETLRHGISTARWADIYENKGKRSGAYSSGCYDSFPYMLLNFKKDDISSVFTLAHEAGHSMHSYYSNKTQTYQDHGYTIFVAEVASTFNEYLLGVKLREKYADDPKMLAFLLNQQLDDIKATFFRQTMFAEFELKTHRMAENNQPLTVDVYREVYDTLLKKYFGATVEIQEIDNLECFRIPHFYSAFYVYKYATGLASAVLLAQRVLAGDTDARERYLAFLKSGCSKYPLELLEDAGVNLNSPEPLTHTLDLFGSLLKDFKSLDRSLLA